MEKERKRNKIKVIKGERVMSIMMEGRKDEGVEIRNKGREKKVYGEEVIIEEGEVKKKKIMEI